MSARNNSVYKTPSACFWAAMLPAGRTPGRFAQNVAKFVLRMIAFTALLTASASTAFAQTGTGACCSPESPHPCTDGISGSQCSAAGRYYGGNGSTCSATDCDRCDDPVCIWCWIGTAAENNCDPAWSGDGECDCGCQFFDSDCPPGAPDIRVAPTSLPFTCTSTPADAAADEVEAGFAIQAQLSFDSAEKLVNPDGVIAARLIAGDERVPVVGSLDPSAALALPGVGDVAEIQSQDAAHPGVLSAGKTAHRQVEFTRLKAAARTTGLVPVIVELAVPNIVALTSRSFAVEAQAGLVQADGTLSAAITAVAQAGFARLAAVPHRPGRVFQYIPFMSLSASERALEVLEVLPFVLDINEQRPARPTLDNTVNIVEAVAAWNRGFDGSGWYVAVLDTGIRATHNFFAGKDIVEACFARGLDHAIGAGDCPNGLSTDISSSHPAQAYPSSFAGYDHGTHVAGIAAGSDPARNPPLHGVARGASIIAIQVFSKFPSFACDPPDSSCVQSWPEDQIAGLEHVFSLRLTHNIASVNMSLGGGGPFSNQTSCDNDNSAVKAIIDSLRTAGIATVIATGNDGFCDGISAPGCISSAIGVGALDDSDFEPAFNNYGTLLDLFAPGVAVLSSVASTDTAYSSFNGTSMAAPHVAGAWAILKQAAPSATVTGAFNALQTAGATIANACSGGGIYPQHRIRIDSAIDALGGGGGCPGLVLAIHNDGQGSLEVSSVSKPPWTFLSPAAPYSIQVGGSRQVCVTVDCSACAGGNLSGSIGLNSNDPDEPAVNVGVSVSCCTPGSTCADDGNSCTHDVYDASCLCTHPRKENGANCPSNGNFCDGNEECQNGVCASMGSPCTVDEWCQEGTQSCLGLADRDGDGDRDLRDVAEFARCFSGSSNQPGYVLPNQDCRIVFDLDGDGDVDGVNWRDFELRFDGPAN